MYWLGAFIFNTSVLRLGLVKRDININRSCVVCVMTTQQTPQVALEVPEVAPQEPTVTLQTPEVVSQEPTGLLQDNVIVNRALKKGNKYYINNKKTKTIKSKSMMGYSKGNTNPSISVDYKDSDGNLRTLEQTLTWLNNYTGKKDYNAACHVPLHLLKNDKLVPLILSRLKRTPIEHPEFPNPYHHDIPSEIPPNYTEQLIAQALASAASSYWRKVSNIFIANTSQ